MMPQKIETEEGLEQLEQLEIKIQRAVELLQAARSEKEALARENSEIRLRLAEQEHEQRLLQERLHHFEKERETVKARVQKLLDQVDALTQAATDAE
jgi:FtsZ-binding cell division protein ZapB